MGILVYEIYQEAVKDIEAANSEFLAKNEILNSLATSITDAKVFIVSEETGAISMSGPADELAHNDAVRKAYLGG